MKVVIVGAGSVGSSIARELLSHKHEILLIDLKPEVIGRSGLRGARWLVGDACELSTLQNAKMEDADVVVSATGDDKVNLVVSLLATTEFGVGRTVGRVNNPKNDWMYAFTRHDLNQNGKLDDSDPWHVFWIDMKNPRNNGEML